MDLVIYCLCASAGLSSTGAVRAAGRATRAMSTEEEAATAAPASDEPPKKKRKSRFGDAPPAAAAEAASAAPAAAPQAAPSTGVSNPLLAAQQALQANSSLAGIVGAAGPAPNPAGPTPGGGANAIPLGGGPGGAPESEREAPKSTIKPGPERLVGAKELRGLDPAAAVAAAAPKASWDDPDLMGPTEAGVVSETMRIPNEAVGLVIGRSGETIRQLQIRAGADIQVSRDQEGDDRGIIIMGPPENVALAKGLVNRIVAEKLESISGGGASPTAPGATSMPGAPMASAGGEVQFLIPQRHVGLVIGSGGQQIRQLQDNSGARIQVAKDPLPGSGHPPDQRQVTLSGDPACVATAKQMIEALMAQDPRSSGGGGGGGGGMGAMPGGVTKVIEIPNHTVGGVIGAQGRNIRYMQETSGAHIQMQKNEDVAPGAANREVTVEGQQAQVDMAVQLIQREVQQQQNRCVRTRGVEDRLAAGPMRRFLLCVCHF
jgi:transcription antitermination factor NusA-like protein